MTIHAKMVEVMKEIGVVPKGEKADYGGGFRYRSIDQLYGALQPALVKAGVTVTPTVLSCSSEPAGKQRLVTATVQYTFGCADSEGTLEVVMFGEGADTGDKAIAKALTSAYKSMVFQTFHVPVEGETQTDAERADPEVKPKASAKKRAAKKAAAKQPSADDRWSSVYKDLGAAAMKRCDELHMDTSRGAELIQHALQEIGLSEADTGNWREAVRLAVENTLTTLGEVKMRIEAYEEGER